MWKSWVTNAKCLHMKSLLIIPLAMPEVQGQTAKSSFFRENKIFHTKIIKWQAQMQPKTQVILFFSNTVMIRVLCLIYLHFVLLCWWPSRNKYKRFRTDIFLVSVPQVKIFFFSFRCEHHPRVSSWHICLNWLDSPVYGMLCYVR